MSGQAERRQLRWYRPALANSVLLTVIPAAISAVCFVRAGTSSGSGRVAALLFGIVLALPALACLITVRAGFGVGADGVLVRRAYGGDRWVPWAEVKRFDYRQSLPTRSGTYFRIAVIRTDDTRLTIGMWASEATDGRKRQQMFDELEAARRAANRQPRRGPRYASDAANAPSELFEATSRSMLMQMHHPEPPPPVDEPDEPPADAGASPGPLDASPGPA